MMELEPGWLERQMKNVSDDVKKWPEWMRREAGFMQDTGTPPAEPRCPVHLAGTQPSPIQCGFRPHKGGQHAGLNDAGEVVWFPADPVAEVTKEWGIRDADRDVVYIFSEERARDWADSFPRCYRLISRTAPGPWQYFNPA